MQSTYSQARGRFAGLTRDRAPDDSELLAARRVMHEERLVVAIERALTKAPPLTDELRARIIGPAFVSAVGVKITRIVFPGRQTGFMSAGAEIRAHRRCSQSGAIGGRAMSPAEHHPMVENIAPTVVPDAKTPAPEWITCARCDTRWTGLSACHCGACHRTFSGLSAFDIHCVRGRCNDPATLFKRNGEPKPGPVTRRYWAGWGQPGQDTRWEDDR